VLHVLISIQLNKKYLAKLFRSVCALISNVKCQKNRDMPFPDGHALKKKVNNPAV